MPHSRFCYHFPLREIKGFFRDCQVLNHGQEMNKIDVEHLKLKAGKVRATSRGFSTLSNHSVVKGVAILTPKRMTTLDQSLSNKCKLRNSKQPTHTLQRNKTIILITQLKGTY